MRAFFASFGAAAMLALFSAPAAAVSPQTQATATARILKPLTIEFQQNLNYGTLVLASGTWSGQVISMDQAGALAGCGGNVTCTGAPAPARYKLTGSNNAIVTISCPGFNMTGPPGGTLVFTPNAPATVNLGATGSSTGVIFGIGGSITLAWDTPDGVYTGNFLVTADYQ
jgi:Mat/Ecp fimbriae major subunit